MSYAYHYHAVADMGRGRTMDLDGIVVALLRIDSQQHFDDLKQQIAKQYGVADVAIHSLSFLHEVEEV